MHGEEHTGILSLGTNRGDPGVTVFRTRETLYTTIYLNKQLLLLLAL
jgi:hypothetical protein